MDFETETQEESQGLPDSEEFLQDFGISPEEYFSLKDYAVFLVDCWSDYYAEVLRIAAEFLKTKILTNENDLFCIILYNSNKTNNTINSEGVNVLVSESNPSSSIINMLMETFQDIKQKDIDSVRNNTASNTEYSLNDALWVCQQELNKHIKQSKVKKRIFLFTSRENPMSDQSVHPNILKQLKGQNSQTKASTYPSQGSHLSSSHKNAQASRVQNKDSNASYLSSTISLLNLEDERKKSIQKGKDLYETDIKIELFPLSNKFNMDLFFKDLVIFDSEEEALHMRKQIEEGFINKLSEICTRIRYREIKKRTLGKLQFYVTPALSIDVDFYSFFNRATKTKTKYVDKVTNKPLFSMNRAMDKETGEVLYKEQIHTFATYTKTKVPFSSSDLSKIKSVDNAGIRLLGFKKLESLKSYYIVGKSYFVFPNEFLSKGASQLCDALIKQLISKNKYALVKFIAREKSKVRICALVPQLESFDEEYFQTPAGFHLIHLAYADELRRNEDIFNNLKAKVKNATFSEPDGNTDNIKLWKDLIKKLKIEFNSRNFENFYLQKFYAVLEAIALKQEEAHEVIDKLTMLDSDYSPAAIEVAEKIKTEFGVTIKTQQPAKIKAGKSKSSKSQTSTRSNLEVVLFDKDPPYYTNDRLKQLIEEEKLNLLKVDLLKGILALKGYKALTKIKKAELIEMIIENIEGIN